MPKLFAKCMIDCIASFLEFNIENKHYILSYTSYKPPF